MSNYVKNQKKITIYYDGHDYYDVRKFALDAADYLERKGTEDAIITYGDTFTLYAKRNKSGITVRQID